MYGPAWAWDQRFVHTASLCSAWQLCCWALCVHTGSVAAAARLLSALSVYMEFATCDDVIFLYPAERVTKKEGWREGGRYRRKCLSRSVPKCLAMLKHCSCSQCVLPVKPELGQNSCLWDLFAKFWAPFLSKALVTLMCHNLNAHIGRSPIKCICGVALSWWHKKWWQMKWKSLREEKPLPTFLLSVHLANHC